MTKHKKSFWPGADIDYKDKVNQSGNGKVRTEYEMIK